MVVFSVSSRVTGGEVCEAPCTSDLNSLWPLQEALTLKMQRTFQVSRMNALRGHCCGSNTDGFVKSTGMCCVLCLLWICRDFGLSGTRGVGKVSSLVRRTCWVPWKWLQKHLKYSKAHRGLLVIFAVLVRTTMKWLRCGCWGRTVQWAWEKGGELRCSSLVERPLPCHPGVFSSSLLTWIIPTWAVQYPQYSLMPSLSKAELPCWDTTRPGRD